MTAEVVVAGLRFLLIVGLYAFLLVVVVVLARGLGPRKGPEPAPMSRATGHARLLVVDGIAQGLPQSFEIDGEAEIGRDPGCAVCLPPSYVSSHHARLEFADDHWWIEDLGSRNKTYVNGEAIPARKPVPASPGDEIAVAGIKLRLADP